VAAPIPELRSAENPPFWRDVRNIRIGGQLLVVGLVGWFLYSLYDNSVTNIASSGLTANFDFLGFDFRQAIPGLDGGAQFSVLRAFGAGYLNVVRVIAFGIPVATLLGIIIGVARLSDNAMARAVGTLYVETFRNIPPLLIIFFFYTVYLLETLPQLDEQVTPLGITVVSNSGLAIPWLNPEASTAGFVGLIALGLVAVGAVLWWRGRVNERTGEPARGGLWGLGTFVLSVLVAHVASGGALALEVPGLIEQDNGIVRIEGGMIIGVPYAGLTIGLTIYTASHIAEIVRGAIQAIAKGQTEAAQAVALNTVQRYRYVILPQAFRIMIPPLASQYLNIVKNSSLGVAISFFELATVFQRVAANATPAVLALLPMMGFYLTFSLSISFIANNVNRRLALEGR
jgi:general L-amino acid transport system permease protein